MTVLGKKGKVAVISGPSGVGKSTICKEAAVRLKGAFLSVSCTSRPKSAAEVDGRDYWFLSRDEFEQRIKKGMFLEYAEVFGNLYGTPKDRADKALEEGKTVILEIDVQGGRQAKAAYPEALMIFILPPSDQELEKRISSRGRDSQEVIARRLSNARAEIDAGKKCYEHFVINESLEKAINEVISIIEIN